MLKLRKITTSIVAGLLVAVMSCSVAFAGQVNSTVVKKNNKIEVTEEKKIEVNETRKNVTRRGRNEAVAGMQQYNNELVPKMKGLIYITVDGVYGPKTREAFIRLWQSEVCARLGYDAVAVDGIFGNESKKIASKFMISWNSVTSVYHVGVVSATLNGLGYKHTLTYGYNADLRNAVIAFQRDNGLAADGVVGPDTYYKLFNK